MAIQLSVTSGGTVKVDLRKNSTGVENRFFDLKTTPTRGNAAIAGDILSYTPVADFAGEDTFFVRVRQPKADNYPIGVVVTVKAPVAPPPPPVPATPLAAAVRALRDEAMASPASLRADPETLQGLLDTARTDDVIVLGPGVYPGDYHMPQGLDALIVVSDEARVTGRIVPA